MLKTIALIACIALAFPVSANAECHFRVPSALACTTPKAAAIAYQKFGNDLARINVSYNKALLRESGCAGVNKQTFAAIKLYEESSGKVATPTGWIDVKSVYIFPRAGVYNVATKYLTGECEKPSEDNESSMYIPTRIQYAMPTTVTP